MQHFELTAAHRPNTVPSFALTLPLCLPGQGCLEAEGRQAVVLSSWAPQLNSSRGLAGAGQGKGTGQRSLGLSWGFHLQHRRTEEDYDLHPDWRGLNWISYFDRINVDASDIWLDDSSELLGAATTCYFDSYLKQRVIYPCINKHKHK